MTEVGHPVLEARELVKEFGVRGGTLRAVNGVTLAIPRGETLGIVGETGCGKSTLARLFLRLLEPTSGEIRFDGADVTHSSRRQLRPLRRDLQIVFQDPFSSLNPRRTVGAIVGEPLRVHKLGSASERRVRVREALEVVGLDPAYSNRYPHQFSGGQRQRIGIARAIVTNPRVIVADEPVSALDVSIQAQILNLLGELRQEFGLTLLVISHDVSVIRHLSSRVAVMYLGRIVELAPAAALFAAPAHPYTAAMLDAVPSPSVTAPRRRRTRVRGEPPSPIAPPPGCAYQTRCPLVQDVCLTVEPPLAAAGSNGRFVACHFALGAGDTARFDGRAST